MKKIYKGYQDKTKQQKIIIKGLESLIDDIFDLLHDRCDKSFDILDISDYILEAQRKYEAYHSTNKIGE